MRTKKELEKLFIKAGRAEAARREAKERDRIERQREGERRQREVQRAEAGAPNAALRIWTWLGGPDADMLRKLLHMSGLNAVTLLGWVSDAGQRLRSARYGAWRISLVATREALWVHQIRSPAGGGQSRSVESADALVGSVPSEIVAALEKALSSGRYERTVRDYVRERAKPGADPPNITRLG